MVGADIHQLLGSVGTDGLGDPRYSLHDYLTGAAPADNDERRLINDLQRLRSKAAADRIRPPATLLVVTATGFGYERRDGVAVAPVTALGP